MLLSSDANFFTSFTLIVCSNLDPDIEIKLADLIWQRAFLFMPEVDDTLTRLQTLLSRGTRVFRWCRSAIQDSLDALVFRSGSIAVSPSHSP